MTLPESSEEVIFEEEKDRDRTSRIYEKLSKISIYLLVFLLPIFFLPWTTNVLDFNKQALLIFLILFSLFTWFFKSLIEGKISLSLNIFNIPAAAFLLVLAIATIFSAFRYGSFWGWPMDVAASFITIFSFVLLYFLIINIFRKKEEILVILSLLIGSSFIVALFGGLQIFGKFLLPFEWAQNSSFNTIGTVNSLGIFLAVLLPLTLILFSITRRITRFLFLGFGLVMLALLFIINFWVIWIVFSVGVAFILLFELNRQTIFKPGRLILITGILGIALIFGIFQVSIPGLPPMPLEVAPTQKASFDIAVQTLRDYNFPVSMFLGSGPSTFVYAHSRFKPETINQTAFWNIRFNSGASAFLDKVTTTGILGMFSWLALLGTFIYLAFRYLFSATFNSKDDWQWILCLGIFAGWLGIVVGSFLYTFNLTLGFVFWLFIACFIALKGGEIKTWTLEPSSKIAIRASLIFVLVLISGIAILFLGGQRYMAENKHFQALLAFQRGDNQRAIDQLLIANSLINGRQDDIWRNLSQLYLFRIRDELQKPAPDQQEITRMMGLAVNSARAATNVAPKNVANWTLSGFTYRQVVNIVEGAEDWAIRSYEEAIRLEPTNPYFQIETALIYLTKADALRLEPEKAAEWQETIATARNYIQRALGLKPDYAPAHFQQAMIYVREEKVKEAIQKLEETKLIARFDDVGLAFQLGVLYYHDEQLERAQIEFERAISFDPNYSNARYFLGLIYDKKDQKDEAISQFEKIAELNPENEEVRKILANLKGGRTALEGIMPTQLPIEEVPLERL